MQRFSPYFLCFVFKITAQMHSNKIANLLWLDLLVCFATTFNHWTNW